MTVLSAQSIRARKLVEPLVERQQHAGSGCSFGLSSAGYDLRIDQDVTIWPGHFGLASTLEHFRMHNDVVAVVHDKSTWARRGLFVQNTVIEPGWRGFLTLELTYHGHKRLFLEAGTPIAQVLFHLLDQTTEQPYPESGKYMDQERGVVEAKDGINHG